MDNGTVVEWRYKDRSGKTIKHYGVATGNENGSEVEVEYGHSVPAIGGNQGGRLVWLEKSRLRPLRRG